MPLYTNTSTRHDFFQNAFTKYGAQPSDVFIAVAFFTYPQPLIDMASNGCRVKIIVRLGYPTKPAALKSILGQEGIQVRFVNDHSFHPKLYIFLESCAVVGSSNLTDPALKTNQEINITVEPTNDDYFDLLSLFQCWWDQAKVLNEERLKEYTDIYEKYREKKDNESLIEKDLQEKQGRVTIKNIERGLRKPSSSEIYLEGYRAKYQEFYDAYQTVEKIYSTTGRRRHDEAVLPLRLEIDSYFSFVREELGKKDTYLHEPLLRGEELEEKIRTTIERWFESPWDWLDQEIVPKRYPTIQRILGSPESIKEASIDEIVEALSTCHSFYDRYRFYRGGHETHVMDFKEKNDNEQVKKTLNYLLFGEDDFVRRMGCCIYDQAYKLNQFGESNVQEVLGWVNDQNIPICNNRTLKALRYLGFDVKPIPD